jgi:guanylate kinase
MIELTVTRSHRSHDTNKTASNSFSLPVYGPGIAITLVMMPYRRCILIGPACSGKDFLRKASVVRCDVSVTTRDPRPGEKPGIDYDFITNDEFDALDGDLFESVEFNGNRYGTRKSSWDLCGLFIMTPSAVKDSLTPEERAESLVIYLDPPMMIRWDRLARRGWDRDRVSSRLAADSAEFDDTDADIVIKTESFDATTVSAFIASSLTTD